MMNKLRNYPKLLLTAKILGIIVLIAVIAHTVAVGVTGSTLRKAKADLAAKGYPMTPADVIPDPVPDEQNAAVELKKVFGLFTLGGNEAYNPGKSAGNTVPPFTDFDDLDNEISKSETPSLRYTDEQMKSLEGLFATTEFQQVFDLLTAASKKDKFYLDHNYEAGPALLLPELSHYRQVSRILSTRAKYEAQLGNKDVALGKIRESLVLANAIAEEPILVSQLVRLACLSITLDAIRTVAYQQELTDTDIENLSKQFEQFEDINPFVNAFHGERILFGQWLFEMETGAQEMSTVGMGDAAALKYYASYPLRPFFNIDYATYLNVMQLNNEALETDLKTALEKDWETQIKEEIGKTAIFTSMLVPVLTRIRIVFATSNAKIQMTEMAIACSNYKRKNGQYPPSLEVVAPGILEEATGEPFAYIEVPQGVIIHSKCDKYDKRLKTGLKDVDGKTVKVCGILLPN